MKQDREEIADIIESFSSLSHNDADHLAGMIVSAGYTKEEEGK